MRIYIKDYKKLIKTAKTNIHYSNDIHYFLDKNHRDFIENNEWRVKSGKTPDSLIWVANIIDYIDKAIYQELLLFSPDYKVQKLYDIEQLYTLKLFIKGAIK